MKPGEEESYYFDLIKSGVDMICTNEPDTLAKKKPELLKQLQLVNDHATQAVNWYQTQHLLVSKMPYCFYSARNLSLSCSHSSFTFVHITKV